MIILALDISTKTGYAVFDTANPELLIATDVVDWKEKSPLSLKYKGTKHPADFLWFVSQYTRELIMAIASYNSDVLVTEQTNKGRNRWSQKLLEWIHYIICDNFPKMVYMDTSEWRKILGIRLSKDEKKTNRRITKANRTDKALAEQEGRKKKIVKGKTDTKKLAIRYAENRFGLDMMVKDNDQADAICIGMAYMIKNGIINE